MTYPDYSPDLIRAAYGLPALEPRRLVWLRSNAVSYSAEIEHRHLGEKGQIVGRPDLAGFTWEPWPGT